MKRFIIAIGIIGLIIPCFIFATEYTVSSYTYMDPKYYTDETMKIRYEDETNDYMFYVSDSYQTIWMVFTEEDLNIMRNTAQKALEWQKVALENKVEVSKEIPNSQLSMKIAEKSGSSFYSGSYKVPVRFNFVSTEGAGLTVLMLVGGSTTASSNKYIDLEFVGQWIMDIQGFADAISEKTISEAISKHNSASSNAEELFK
ncbi:MAG: hypothetical protein IJ863_03020 [Spirochaetales bacterium]|nr:hypothetical protein [Spirochaetales bacterium]